MTACRLALWQIASIFKFMGGPKDITESLTRWQGGPPSPAPAPSAEASLSQRRLRMDVPGGIIYTLVIGALLSQLVFLITFDLF